MPYPPLISLLEYEPDGVLRVVLHGELGYDTAPFARRAIERAQASAAEVLIDLSGLSSVDPFGLAVLLSASRSEGVSVTNLSPAAREACRRTDTEALFESA